MARKQIGFHPACKVCQHDDRMTIDLALARGATASVILNKWPELSSHSLYRHFHRHIPQQVLERLRIKSLGSIVGKSINVAELTDTENQSILSQIVALKSSLMGAISVAERADAGQLFSSLAGRLTKLLEVEARILGQISTGSVTTVNNYIASESFIAIRAMLMEELQHDPTLRMRIARRLLAFEAPKRPDLIDATRLQIAGDDQLPAHDIIEIGQDEAPASAKATTDGDRPRLLPVACPSFAPTVENDRETLRCGSCSR